MVRETFSHYALDGRVKPGHDVKMGMGFGQGYRVTRRGWRR